MLLPVGEELIDDVHDAPEEGGADGQALLFVERARPHVVERFGRLPDVQPPDRPGRRLRPGGHLGHAQHGVEAEGVIEMVQKPVGVAVEQDRRLARRPDAGRLHLGLVDRTRGKAQIIEDLGGDGELDRSGQFES